MAVAELKKVRIKLKQGIAGNGFAHEPNAEIDWPEDEAARFVKCGYAEYIPNSLPAENMERAEVRRAEKR